MDQSERSEDCVYLNVWAHSDSPSPPALEDSMFTSSIPGGVPPGYISLKPDFPECIDDFGFPWFETEYAIDIASK